MGLQINFIYIDSRRPTKVSKGDEGSREIGIIMRGVINTDTSSVGGSQVLGLGILIGAWIRVQD